MNLTSDQFDLLVEKTKNNIRESNRVLAFEDDVPVYKMNKTPFGIPILKVRGPSFLIRPETILSRTDLPINPFRPYDRSQFICKLEKSGLVVLINRFCASPLYLVLPEEFKSNFLPLYHDDFIGIAEIMNIPWSIERDICILKNIGAVGSQTHLHFNLFELNPEEYPLYSNLKEYVMSNTVSGSGFEFLRIIKNGCGENVFFDYPHCVFVLPETNDVTELANAIEKNYSEAIKMLDLRTEPDVNARTIKMVCPMSNLNESFEDETVAVQFTSSLKPHKVYFFKEWMFVTGPIVDLMAYGRAFDLFIQPNALLMGQATWTKPLKIGEELSEEILSVIKTKSLGDLIRGNFNPNEEQE